MKITLNLGTRSCLRFTSDNDNTSMSSSPIFKVPLSLTVQTVSVSTESLTFLCGGLVNIIQFPLISGPRPRCRSSFLTDTTHCSSSYCKYENIWQMDNWKRTRTRDEASSHEVVTSEWPRGLSLEVRGRWKKLDRCICHTLSRILVSTGFTSLCSMKTLSMVYM